MPPNVHFFFKCSQCGMNNVSRKEFQEWLPLNTREVFHARLQGGALGGTIEFLGRCPLCAPRVWPIKVFCVKLLKAEPHERILLLTDQG